MAALDKLYGLRLTEADAAPYERVAELMAIKPVDLMRMVVVSSGREMSRALAALDQVQAGDTAGGLATFAALLGSLQRQSDRIAGEVDEARRSAQESEQAS